MNQFLTPFYLGKSSDSDTYYFLANKAGVGRFIKYIKYPFWCGSSDVSNFLVFVDPPEEIIEEVISFVSGKVSYEVIPKKRGRAERVVRIGTEQSAINKMDGESNVTSSQNSQNEVTTGSKSSNRSNRSKSKEKLPEKTKDSSESCNISKQLLQSTEADKRVIEGIKTRPAVTKQQFVDPDFRNRGLSALLGRSPGSSIRGELSSGIPKLPTTKFEPRRVVDPGVLDERRNETSTNAVGASDNETKLSTVNGVSNVDGRVKRKRRTKAEMIAARALEAKQT